MAVDHGLVGGVTVHQAVHIKDCLSQENPSESMSFRMRASWSSMATMVLPIQQTVGLAWRQPRLHCRRI